MKQSITLFLALILALSLCACTKTENPETTGSTNAATSPSTTPSDTTNPSEPVDEGNFFLVSQIKNRIIDDEDYIITLDLTYDEAHNITGFQIFEADVLSAAYTFDKSIDKPLTALYYDENGVVESREECTYNENGDILTARSYIGDEMMTEAVYTYDEHGNVLTKYYDNGEEDWTETYENAYENGVLTEVKVYYDDALQELYQYDSDGNVILDTNYYEDVSYRSTQYTYENGNLILMVDFWGDTESSCEEYTYNDNGDLLTRVITSGGSAHYREECSYNDAGQLVEIKYLNDDSYSANTVYTYGEDGSPESVLAYDDGELELESTFTSQKVTVSEEQAKLLTALYALLIEEWT